MRKFFSFTWNRGRKYLAFGSFRKDWIAHEIDPFIGVVTNGAEKNCLRDTCLDVKWHFGYLCLNYTDYDYNRKYRDIHKMENRLVKEMNRPRRRV